MKKKREEEVKQLTSTWQKWLNKEKKSDAGCSLPITFIEEKDRSTQDSDNESVIEKQKSFSSETINTNNIVAPKDEIIDEKELLNTFDPTTWQHPYSYSLITALVKRGPEQGTEADYLKFVDNEGRRFSTKWLYKIMSNGETVKRDWLTYSRNRGSIFCFSCLLFGTCNFRPSKLADPYREFSNWKKLNSKINEHENS